ncbi:hypothetical protein ACIQXI_05255 [Lysinibacillus sp. NPDC097195]|uniref:hypothetical protein n=1 Tax=Lysinibacillus sp. NPDC097195 TaxID=3364141 RepID=UPI0038024A5C
MSILNPQYAFLAVDFNNPNLTQVALKVENNSDGVKQQNELVENTKVALKILPNNFYIRLYGTIGWLIWIPVDLYCAAGLVVVKFFSY